MTLYLAKIIPDRDEPFITPVDEGEGFLSVTGAVGVKQRERKAWLLPGGRGAAAISESPEGAVASARCLLDEIKHQERIRLQRDRA